MRRILLVDEDKGDVEVVTKSLTENGFTIQTATDSDTALHRLKAWKPHLILINIDSAKIQGASLVPKIRTLTHEEYTSIVLVSAIEDLAEVKRTLEGGADDYLTKPFRSIDLLPRVIAMLRLKEVQDSLKRANHRIEELISADELTGLMNMRAAFRRGEEEIARARKFRKPISCLLLNLDGFSAVNQTYGFAIGSQVLQQIALCIKQFIRPIDLVARVGADEFFVLLNEMDLAGAETVAETIRAAVQVASFKNERRAVKLTVTVGVAGLTYEQNNQRMGDLLHIAAEALKSAKANGPNRIEVYSFT